MTVDYRTAWDAANIERIAIEVDSCPAIHHHVELLVAVKVASARRSPLRRLVAGCAPRARRTYCAQCGHTATVHCLPW